VPRSDRARPSPKAPRGDFPAGRRSDDPIFDNSDIEFEICRKWATSEAGRQAKTDNPNGYRNVLLHGKLHYMANMQQQMTEQQQGQAPPEKPAENTQTPIQGEQDVQTAQ
jgi:hypothetical protein